MESVLWLMMVIERGKFLGSFDITSCNNFISLPQNLSSQPGCQCSNGFTGPHCEIISQGSNKNDHSNKTLAMGDDKETSIETARQSDHSQEKTSKTESEEEAKKLETISNVRPHNSLPDSTSKPDSVETSNIRESMSPVGVTGIVLVILIGLSILGVLRYRHITEKIITTGDSRILETSESGQLCLSLHNKQRGEYRDYLIPDDDELDNAFIDEDLKTDPKPSPGLLL
jgi:hypothetical protein